MSARTRASAGAAGISHVDHLFELALLEEGEEGLRGPVDAHDVDVEALIEVVPGRRASACASTA